MDYDELVAKVIELLQREKRVPYRILKRRFELDDDYIEDVKIDLIEAKRLAVDENDSILVWIGDAQAVAPQPAQTKPCHDLLYISGDFRRLYPVGSAWAVLGDAASPPWPGTAVEGGKALL